MTCGDTTHPSVLDAQLLTQELDLGPKPFIVRIEPHLSDGAAASPQPGSALACSIVTSRAEARRRCSRRSMQPQGNTGSGF